MAKAMEVLVPSFFILSVQFFAIIDGAIKSSVGCGRQGPNYAPRLPSPKHRVINGQDAKQHSWPWAVIQERNGNIFCGGTLLRVKDDIEESDVVLTAAHCVGIGKTDDPDNYKGWTMTAGSHWRKKTVDGQEKRNVIKAIHHQDYTPVKNDIAVALLDKPIKFSDTIRPICLPKQDEDPPIGRVCVVAGWGRNESDKPTLPADALQQSVQPVHEAPICKKPWGGTFVNDLMLCVGVLDGTSGACNGDSGGMLTCKVDDGHWVQYGVMSFVGGKGRCVDPGWPSVFARVSTYTDWIGEQIKQLSSLVKKRWRSQ